MRFISRIIKIRITLLCLLEGRLIAARLRSRISISIALLPRLNSTGVECFRSLRCGTLRLVCYRGNFLGCFMLCLLVSCITGGLLGRRWFLLMPAVSYKAQDPASLAISSFYETCRFGRFHSIVTVELL